MKGLSGIRVKDRLRGGNKPGGRRPVRKSLMSFTVEKGRIPIRAVAVAMERNRQVQEDTEVEWKDLDD